jgi:hypothetical protein
MAAMMDFFGHFLAMVGTTKEVEGNIDEEASDTSV